MPVLKYTNMKIYKRKNICVSKYKINKLQVQSSELLAKIALPILDVVRGEAIKMVLLPDYSALEIKKTLRAFLSGRWASSRLKIGINQNENDGYSVERDAETIVTINHKGEMSKISVKPEHLIEILKKEPNIEEVAFSPDPFAPNQLKAFVDRDDTEEYILEKEEGWGCTLCGKILSTKWATKVHIKKKCKLQKMEQENLEIDTKEEREESDDLFAHLPRHMRNAAIFLRRKESEKKCRFCKVTLSSLKEMEEHKKRYADGNEWTCPEKDCNRRYSGSQDRQYLEAHMNSHRGITEYKCDQCGKEFHGKIAYDHHEKTHRVKLRQLCQLCPKSSPKFPRDLKSHVKNYHEDKRTIECDICGKLFKVQNKRALTDHIKVHENKREFPCSSCPRKFNTSSYLNLHIITVHEKRIRKDYKCTSCGKDFRSNAKLKEHEYIHTGERPFQCTECGRTFVQGGNLKSHAQKCAESGNKKKESAAGSFATKAVSRQPGHQDLDVEADQENGTNTKNAPLKAKADQEFTKDIKELKKAKKQTKEPSIKEK